MFKSVIIGVLSGLLLCPVGVAAQTIADLVARDKYTDVKISPDGTYLSVRMFSDAGYGLVNFNRETLQPVGVVRMPGENEIGAFHWVSDQRLVVQILMKPTGLDVPVYYGELLAVNVDGGKSEMIHSYRASSSSISYSKKDKKKKYSWGYFVDPLKHDDKNILIQSVPMEESKKGLARLHELDVFSGKEGRRVTIAKHRLAEFYTDNEGNLKLITSIDDDRRRRVHMYDNKSREQIEVPFENYGDGFDVVGIDDSGASAIVKGTSNSDKIGVHKLDLQSLQHKSIYTHKDVDITAVLKTTDNSGVYGVRVDDGYPSYLLLPSEHKEAIVFKYLLQQFPGMVVSVTSRDESGRFWTIHVSDDVNPGYFFLYDMKSDKLQPLFKRKPNLDLAALSRTEPVSFSAPDGTLIHGYLTRAAKPSGRLMVWVHGGPRTRDYWGFDREVQALALNGISVLQVNYRGSAGYGFGFRDAGNGHWLDLVQQDIIAGARWALAEGHAQAGGICIGGSSFGGFSALQSSLMAPDLFRCVVAHAGLYDLSLMHDEGDTPDTPIGESYLNEVIGSDIEYLKKHSPAYNLQALKAPLFLAHGLRDQRVPIEHAEILVKELDRHNKTYEWFRNDREGHSLYDPATAEQFLTRMIDFVKKNTVVN